MNVFWLLTKIFGVLLLIMMLILLSSWYRASSELKILQVARERKEAKVDEEKEEKKEEVKEEKKDEKKEEKKDEKKEEKKDEKKEGKKTVPLTVTQAKKERAVFNHIGNQLTLISFIGWAGALILRFVYQQWEKVPPDIPLTRLPNPFRSLPTFL